MLREGMLPHDWLEVWSKKKAAPIQQHQSAHFQGVAAVIENALPWLQQPTPQTKAVHLVCSALTQVLSLLKERMVNNNNN